MEFAGARPRQTRTPPPRPPPPGVSAVQGDSQQASTAFKNFHQLHDKAFAAVEKGLTADSDGDLTAAEQYYTEGFALLEQVLNVDCENLPGASAGENDQAKLMQQKMSKTKWQIMYRLEALRGDANHRSTAAFSDLQEDQSNTGVRLPSYEEAVSSVTTSFSSITTASIMSDAALGDSIMATEYPNRSSNRLSTQGTELFSISEGVQIFYITPEGFVSAPSYPTSLHVICLEKPEDGETDPRFNRETPPAFVQVGEWFYPLIPGASPVLHTTYGAYIFPDLSAENTGSAVGLMLPGAMTQEDTVMLEDIFRNFSAVQDQQRQLEPEDLVIPSAPVYEPQEATAPKAVAKSRGATEKVTEEEPEQSTSSKIARGITIASQWISWGVGKGAEKAGELIVKGSEKLRDRLQPEAQARTVDPRIEKGLVYARAASHAAVSVSSFIVTKLGDATMALGRKVAPHIRKKGEELMPKSMKNDKNKSTMEGVIHVAACGIHGFGTVYMSLEAAATSLARSIANETVATVHHKYGAHAGQATEHALYTVGNAAMTGYNVEHLGVKAIAKRAAKDTGKAVLEDIHAKKAT